MRPKWAGSARASQAQITFWGLLAALTGLLLWAGRARAHWPWFSLWLLLLLGGVAALSIPRVRQALRISWFGVTLITLTGVCLANVFLFYVESHRQRSCNVQSDSSRGKTRKPMMKDMSHLSQHIPFEQMTLVTGTETGGWQYKRTNVLPMRTKE